MPSFPSFSSPLRAAPPTPAPARPRRSATGTRAPPSSTSPPPTSRSRTTSSILTRPAVYRFQDPAAALPTDRIRIQGPGRGDELDQVLQAAWRATSVDVTGGGPFLITDAFGALPAACAMKCYGDCEDGGMCVCPSYCESLRTRDTANEESPDGVESGCPHDGSGVDGPGTGPGSGGSGDGAGGSTSSGSSAGGGSGAAGGGTHGGVSTPGGGW